MWHVLLENGGGEEGSRFRNQDGEGKAVQFSSVQVTPFLFNSHWFSLIQFSLVLFGSEGVPLTVVRLFLIQFLDHIVADLEMGGINNWQSSTNSSFYR